MKRIIVIGILLLTLVGCNHLKLKQKNTITLNVYELQDSNEIYRITSANYLKDESFNNITLRFCSNDEYNLQTIDLVISGKPTKVTKIKSFESRKDTTSYIRIK